jgi:hypothetical protein
MRSFKVYIDENLPVQLASGLNELQKPLNRKDNLEIKVQSIKEVFGAGTKDEDWIPKVGKEHAIVITQDYRIQTQKHQKALYESSGVGILFLSPPAKSGFSYWEMVKQLINRWPEITNIIIRYKPPFAFRCTSRTKFERMN